VEVIEGPVSCQYLQLVWPLKTCNLKPLATWRLATILPSAFLSSVYLLCTMATGRMPGAAGGVAEYVSIAVIVWFTRFTFATYQNSWFAE